MVRVLIGFASLVSYEVIQNAPLLIGFLAAAKMRRDAQPGSYWWFLELALSMLVGSAVLFLTEDRKKGSKIRSAAQIVKDTIKNFFIMTGVSLLALLYCTASWHWLSWKTDLGAAVLVGVLLASVQGIINKWQTRQFILHMFAVVSASVITLPLVRLLIAQSWWTMFSSSILLVSVASIVIVGFDYWPQFIARTLASKES